MADTKQIGINLPGEAARDWKAGGRGYPNTMIALAGFAAWMTLTREQQDDLMSRVGPVYEQRKYKDDRKKTAKWAAVREWWEMERLRLDRILGEHAELRAQGEIGRRLKRPSKRR